MKSMNTTEFYKKLLENRNHTRFFLEGGQIRARLTTGSYKYQTFCPITLVAYNVTGQYFQEGCYQEAARSIKLRQREANKIVDAADYVNGGNSPKIRKKLLEVTKAKPV